MKYKVIYSPESLDDLRSLYSHIAFRLHEPRTAQEQTDRIRKEIRALNELPERYAPVGWEPWASMGMRHFSVDNFIVYYLVEKDVGIVSIARIFYGGRDIESIMTDQ